VRDFGTARFKKELSEVNRVAPMEISLCKTPKPWRTIGKLVFPFADGEPLAV
jgi:hypothetical protein